MAKEWYFASGGAQSGPIELAELQQLASSGRLRPEDLVWREGMGEWVAASTLGGLFATANAAEAPAPMHVAPAPAAAPENVLPYVGGSVGMHAGYAEPGVTPRVIEMLRQTRPWVLLFSVLLFIGAGLQFLGGIFMTFASMITGGGAGGRASVAPSACISVFYVVIGCLYFFPALFLARYSSRIATLSTSRRAADLESALEAQKSFWKFWGIMMLVMIVFVVLMIVIAIIGGAMMGGMGRRGF